MKWQTIRFTQRCLLYKQYLRRTDGKRKYKWLCYAVCFFHPEGYYTLILCESSEAPYIFDLNLLFFIPYAILLLVD